MSKSYKKAMDRITMSPELRQTVIRNTSEAAEKKNSPEGESEMESAGSSRSFPEHKKVIRPDFVRRTAGVAACFMMCLLSYQVITDFGEPLSTMEPVPSGAAVSVEKPEEDSSSFAPSDGQLNGTQKPAYAAENRGNKEQPATGKAGEDGEDSAAAASEAAPQPGQQQEPSGDASEPLLQAGPGSSGSDTNPGLSYYSETYDSVSRLERDLGFSIKTPSYVPEDYHLTSMSLIAGTMAEFQYESETDSIFYRTSKGFEDISGDHRVWTDTEVTRINEWEVTFRSSDMLCGSVSWTDQENTYSILSINGMEHNEMEQMVRGVK
ncbi:MAG: hypothetical protein ACI4VM_06825 [Anaerovoracaceae bacterium]